MNLQTVIGVLVASLMPLLIASVWYRRSMGLGGMARVFGGTFLLALVMTINLAMFLGPHPSLAFATAAGAAAGVGWTAAGFGITYLFERRPLKLWLVNGGYHAVTLTVIGAVLGVFSMFGQTNSSEVRITSYVSPSGDRVLRHEVDLNA